MVAHTRYFLSMMIERVVYVHIQILFKEAICTLLHLSILCLPLITILSVILFINIFRSI